jgi:hypothetical protein
MCKHCGASREYHRLCGNYEEQPQMLRCAQHDDAVRSCHLAAVAKWVRVFAVLVGSEKHKRKARGF